MGLREFVKEQRLSYYVPAFRLPESAGAALEKASLLYGLSRAQVIRYAILCGLPHLEKELAGVTEPPAPIRTPRTYIPPTQPLSPRTP